MNKSIKTIFFLNLSLVCSVCTAEETAVLVENVLIPGNASRICVADGQGTGKHVDPNSLLEELLKQTKIEREAQVILWDADDAQPNLYQQLYLNRKHSVYKVLREKKLTKALDALDKMNGAIITTLSDAEWQSHLRKYVVTGVKVPPQNGDSISKAALVRDIIDGGAGAYIACVDDTSKKPISWIRFRGKVDELPLSGLNGDKFNKLETAQIAYSEDRQSSESSTNTKLGLGIDVFDAVGKKTAGWGFVPFVAYESSSTDKEGSEDVEHFTYGAFVNREEVSTPKGAWFGVGGNLAFSLRRTEDKVQDAKIDRGELTWNISPFSGNRYWCNTDTLLFNSGALRQPRLAFNCGLKLFVTYIDVRDPGSNIDLAQGGDDNFTGVGAELSISLTPRGAYLPWKNFNNISLRGGYRYMAVSGDGLGNQSRRFAELAYAPSGLKHVEIKVTYVSGENVQTFQEEETVTAAIGFRY